jgi:hypothetical protein
VPSEVEVAPWFDAVCALWDDGELYQAMATRARHIAETCYSEARSRARHLEFFTSATSSHRWAGSPPAPDEGAP